MSVSKLTDDLWKADLLQSGHNPVLNPHKCVVLDVKRFDLHKLTGLGPTSC
jgi:hypothetical protein